MTRGIAAALVTWTLLAAAWFLFFSGGDVLSCLGPLGVTPETCRAAHGLPPETDLDRFLHGPGLLVVALVAGWAVIVVIATVTARRRSDRV